MPIKEKYFQLLTENATVGVYVIDERQMFEYVNHTLASMLGYEPEELIGTVSFLSVIHPDDVHLLARHYRQTLGEDVPPAHLETRALHKNGNIVNIQIFGTYIDSNDKRSLVGTIIDITARTTAEEQLLEHQHALETLNRTLEQRITEALMVSREKDRIVMQQARFAAMGEMVAGIAHQWRQPLNMLGLSIQALQLAQAKGTLNKEFMERHGQKSMEVLQSMSQTIDDFRNFFQPEKEPSLFHLDEAIERVVTFFSSSVHKINITTDLGSQATICGHMNELSQAILNILNNAHDALKTSKVAEPAIVVSVTREKNMSLIRVTDNAGGIPEQVIDRVFDPFFSTKDSTKGTGLGLYMVKLIVEKSMKGTVGVRNTDTGAEFCIQLRLHGNNDCSI